MKKTTFGFLRAQANSSRRFVVRAMMLCLLINAVSACGRFNAPIPPELVAPEAVNSLTVEPLADGVAFTWRASDQDQRGKELKFIDGYRVNRKEVVQRGDETDPDVKFDEVAFLPDTHVVLRDELRKEARAKGQLGRRAKPTEDTMKFAFKDTEVSSGKTYVYQIVPINQGGVKGEVKQLIKVYFSGDKSEISIIDSSTGIEKDSNKEKEKGKSSKLL